MSWSYWIGARGGFENDYDKILEQVCKEFNLTLQTRKEEVVDKRQFVAEWFVSNKWKFVKYRTNKSIAKIMGVKTQSSIVHLSSYRKKKLSYKLNTKKVAEFLRNY